MPSRYKAHTKAKAIRLIREHAGDYPPEYAAITSRTTLTIFLAGSAARKCSNRTGRNQPPFDPVRTAYLRERPAPTPMPPDGKEKVYSSRPLEP